MEALDSRANSPRTFRVNVAEIAKAAGCQPSVVFYHKVRIWDLDDVTDFVMWKKLEAKFKERIAKPTCREESKP